MEKSTQAPIVPVDQNGTGLPYYQQTVLDSLGRTALTVNQLGVATQFSYNNATGAMVQKIADVDPESAESMLAFSALTSTGQSLVTDYQSDNSGRLLREFGPVHEVQLRVDEQTIEAAMVRTMKYTVYRDDLHQVWNASGYARGNGPNYTFVTVGAVHLSYKDEDGRVTDEIEAIRECNMGPLSEMETFPRSRWRRWTHQNYDVWGRLLSQRVYHRIPESGDGERNYNYNETCYGYDNMGRQNRVVSPGGTITRVVFDSRGLTASQWVGTNDTAATNTDPTGGGAPGNNMVQVLANEYDNGEDMGDGLLTQVTRPVDDTEGNDRVVEYSYDFRDRLVDTTTTDGISVFISRNIYDNLDRVIGVDTYHTSVTDGNLTGRTQRYYDSTGRVYREEIYAVDPDSGTATLSMVGEKWYDPTGKLVRQTSPGSEAITLLAYDSLGREVMRYLAYEPPSESSSSSSHPSSDSSSSSSHHSSHSSQSSRSSRSSISSSSEGLLSSSSSDPSRSSSSYTPPSSSHSTSSSSSSTSSSSTSSSSSISQSIAISSSSNTIQPPPPSCDSCDNTCAVNGNPVRLAIGQIVMEETDLSTQGFIGWAHTRSYGNLLGGEGSGSNGNLWFVVQFSSLMFNVGEDENYIVATRGANSSLWFKPDGMGGWQAMFTQRATLVHDVLAGRYVLTTPEGYRYVYFDDSMAVPVPMQGRLESYADPYGLTIMLEYDEDFQMVRLNQTDGFQSNVFVYSYLGAGANAGQMERVALEINDVPVREVLYSYFGEGETGGGVRDLKRVIIRDYNATTSTWATVRRTAYRYYISGGSGGFAHGLKFELRPESYNQMASAGLDPLTASDAVWASYADKYFEYDTSHRVVLEKVHGGRETYTLAYVLNPDEPGYDDNNNWSSKTTETRPNGTTFTVYANKATRTILSKLTDENGNLWYNFNRFDEQGRLELQAMPSAVESVIEPDETSNTLTVVLKSHEGLVKVYTYYASTNPSTGAVATYLESEGVKEGADGDLIVTRRLTYATHTVDGISIYPLASVEVFPVAGEAGNVTVYDTAYYSTTGGNPGLGDLPLHPGNELDLEDLIVVEQSQTTWNEASEQILSTQWQRFDDATGPGELHGPDDLEPKARRSYQAAWFDGIGRSVATADYGTNGGMELVRPPVAPARSDIVLVSTTHYRDEGEANATKDANGIETRWQNDDAGRRIRLIENFCAGVAAGSPDANRTTEYAYAPDGGLCRLTLINAVTGDQVTRWEFGTTLADSKIARSDLLRTKLFPSSNGNCACGELTGMQCIQYSYNRRGQVIEMTDPNSTVHAYDFDGLGRTTQDRVTALGAGIDASVRRIQTTYDLKRQLRAKVTSYDDPVVGEGAVLNEVAFEYDALAQLAADRQAHAGPVDLDTPSVLYHNDIGYHNSARRQYMVYPDGIRVLNYDYGPDGEAGDRLSRVQALIIAGEADPVCRYTYMGSARCVDIAYPQPGVELSYRKTTDAPVGDAGDPYNGYDRFGRTVDMRWLYGGNDGTVLDRIQYGYDRASNRTWRKNLAAASGQDQAWTYDGLYQVKAGALGTLNINQTAIGGIPASAEAWNYDPTGNWQRWQQSVDGETQLDQSRISNRDNQITQIDGSCDGIAYDKAGNTLLIPPDAAGSWTTPQALVWDAWNRLVVIKTAGSEEVISEYAYDGLFRRIMKLATTEIRHYYFNDQWKCLEERAAEPPPPSSSSSEEPLSSISESESSPSSSSTAGHTTSESSISSQSPPSYSSRSSNSASSSSSSPSSSSPSQSSSQSISSSSSSSLSSRSSSSVSSSSSPSSSSSSISSSSSPSSSSTSSSSTSSSSPSSSSSSLDRIPQPHNYYNCNDQGTDYNLLDSAGTTNFAFYGGTMYPAYAPGICQEGRSLNAHVSGWFSASGNDFNPRLSAPLYISIWFKPEATTGRQVLVNLENGYQIILKDGNSVLFQISTTGVSWDKQAAAPGFFEAGEWSHLVAWIIPGVEIGLIINGGGGSTLPLSEGEFAWLGEGATIYLGHVDGEISSSSSHSSSSSSSTEFTSLSESGPSSSSSSEERFYSFKGVIDEIAFFQVELNSDELAALYDSGSGLFYRDGHWSACPGSFMSMRSIASTVEMQVAGSLDAPVVCQYVWGARSGHRDELILRNSASPSSSSGSESSGDFLNERLWCLMDYYDPTSIVDNSGAVVERYRFSAFGLRSIMAPDFSPRTTSDYDWDFAFKGQFLDLDTGYYNYGYRFYSPELGRWLSRDPIGEMGGANLFRMSNNDAVNRWDLLGLTDYQVIFSLITFGDGGVAAYDAQNGEGAAAAKLRVEQETVEEVKSYIKSAEEKMRQSGVLESDDSITVTTTTTLGGIGKACHAADFSWLIAHGMTSTEGYAVAPFSSTYLTDNWPTEKELVAKFVGKLVGVCGCNPKGGKVKFSDILKGIIEQIESKEK